MGIFRTYLHSIKGVAAIEFAIVLPVFLWVIFGSIELGYLMWANSSLNYGATYGARYAFTNPTATPAAIEAYAQSTVTFPSSVMTFTVTPSTDGVDITGSMTYTFLVVPLSPITLTVHEHQVRPL